MHILFQNLGQMVQAQDAVKVDRRRFPKEVMLGTTASGKHILEKYGYRYDTVEQIIKATESDDFPVRNAALEILIEKTGEQGKPVLMKALDDSEVFVRLKAAQLLCEILRQAECQKKGLTAILGAGFDPGVVNAYAALGLKHHFDAIDTIDIMDIGSVSYSAIPPFSTIVSVSSAKYFIGAFLITSIGFTDVASIALHLTVVVLTGFPSISIQPIPLNP